MRPCATWLPRRKSTHPEPDAAQRITLESLTTRHRCRRTRRHRVSRIAARRQAARERRDRERKENVDPSRRQHLESLRIIERNVAYVAGLPARLCDEKVRGPDGHGPGWCAAA